MGVKGRGRGEGGGGIGWGREGTGREGRKSGEGREEDGRGEEYRHFFLYTLSTAENCINWLLREQTERCKSVYKVYIYAYLRREVKYS